MVAPTYVGKYESSGNVTSGTYTFTSTIPAGTVVVVSAHAGGTVDLSVSSSPARTWTALTQRSNSSGAIQTTRMFAIKLATDIVNTNTVTVTRAATGGLAFMVFTLPDTYVLPVVDEDSGMSNASVTTLTLDNALTVPTGGGTVLMAGTTNINRTFTTGGAATLVEQCASTGTGNPRVGGLGYIDAAAGSSSPTLVITSGNAFAATGAVFVQDEEEPPTPIAGTVGIIGDSLTFRADSGSVNSRESVTRGRLEAAGYDPLNIYWHGVGGKQLLVADSSGDTTLENIDECVAQFGGPPDQLVIALGTNFGTLDATQFGDAIDTILDKCEAVGVGHVYWVNIGFWSPANTNAATYNPVIDARVGARSNTTVLDYNTHMGDPRTASHWIFPTDSTHLTTEGYEVRDAFIIEAITNGVGGASLQYSWATTASGTTTREGAASAAYTYDVAAQGSVQREGTGSLAYAWDIGAQGTSSNAGAASLDYVWGALAAGERASSGQGSLTYAWDLTAAGEAPDVPGAGGGASLAYSWGLSAAGERMSAGVSVVDYAWDITGAGARQSVGTATIPYVFAVNITGAGEYGDVTFELVSGPVGHEFEIGLVTGRTLNLDGPRS